MLLTHQRQNLVWVNDMALTPAQKQAAYRERQKNDGNVFGNVTENVTDEEINQEIEAALQNVGFYEFSREHKKQFTAHVLLRIFPELADKDFVTTLFVTSLRD